MNTNKTNHLQSKSFVIAPPQRSWSCPLFVISTFVATVIVGFSLYYYTHNTIQTRLVDSEQRLMTILTQNSQFITENKKLKKELAIALQQATLAEEAISEKTELHQTLQTLQDENLDLKKQLAFYGNLLASSDAPELQVVVKSFTLKREKERQYTYHLSLTQFARNARTRHGQVDINVMGMQNSQEKSLAMDEITEDSTTFLKYSFRYFQNFEGRLILPKQFIPKQVMVNILPNGQKQPKPISFAWQDLQ